MMLKDVDEHGILNRVVHADILEIPQDMYEEFLSVLPGGCSSNDILKPGDKVVFMGYILEPYA
jgi:hypothetical protein